MWIWARRNLFSTPMNTALTILALALLYLSLPPLIGWAFLDANWLGETREEIGRAHV